MQKNLILIGLIVVTLLSGCAKKKIQEGFPRFLSGRLLPIWKKIGTSTDMSES